MKRNGLHACVLELFSYLLVIKYNTKLETFYRTDGRTDGRTKLSVEVARRLKKNQKSFENLKDVLTFIKQYNHRTGSVGIPGGVWTSIQS